MGTDPDAPRGATRSCGPGRVTLSCGHGGVALVAGAGGGVEDGLGLGQVGQPEPTRALGEAGPVGSAGGGGEQGELSSRHVVNGDEGLSQSSRRKGG